MPVFIKKTTSQQTPSKLNSSSTLATSTYTRNGFLAKLTTTGLTSATLQGLSQMLTSLSTLSAPNLDSSKSET
jgi:hypothetical protein